MSLDMIVRGARLPGGDGLVDIGIADGRIAAVAPVIDCDAPAVAAEGMLLVPGFVETHLHLDKTCILDRCTAAEGTVAEAVKLTAAAKQSFTAEDVYDRGRQTLERALAWGTTRIRTHVEVDPGIGMRGFDGVQQLARDYAWAADIELCVFPQEGLLNNPGTDALLQEGLRRGARVIGAVPYIDSDPRGQIDRIFELAREFDVDIDMHLDMGETTDGMQADYVCHKTEEYGWGGRVAIGHVSQSSLLPRAAFLALAARLASAGVAVTVLPATDLFLTGRSHDHAVPRGVPQAQLLRGAGVTCSVATNNVLNPFTPYGDANLLRMANLFANVCQVARPAELAGCLEMVTSEAARLMRLPDYGLRVGGVADLVLLDATTAEGAVAQLAQPLWGMKAGRMVFTRPRPTLHRPGCDCHP
ncbi:amidohydrolase family protein [Acidisphaera sp. L21]|uniref:amidohydrolase family protein n=1 Tax=Acidisphaera sp. L21 TaxID=1641851 RepID=UPI00131B3A04|nr:amidohydrolase family protein [Acidisphaera sp. L21]